MKAVLLPLKRLVISPCFSAPICIIPQRIKTQTTRTYYIAISICNRLVLFELLHFPRMLLWDIAFFHNSA
jgi:hypothetical protein